MDAYCLICLGAKPTQRLLQRNRDSNDNPARLLTTNSANGCEHGVAGCQSIVDQDDGSTS